VEGGGAASAGAAEGSGSGARGERLVVGMAYTGNSEGIGVAADANDTTRFDHIQLAAARFSD
jgi:hypothetical protein